MKTKLLFLLIFLMGICTYAQKPEIKSSMLNKDSIPEFIEFETKKQFYTKDQTKEVFRHYLNLTPPKDQMRKIGTTTDKMGQTHIKYQQYYKGIKVEYGQYKAHFTDNKIRMISGNYILVRNVSVKPVISEKVAFEKAVKHVGADKYAWESQGMERMIKEEKGDDEASYYPKGKLVIWSANKRKKIRLAYKFDIFALSPPTREYVFVDAKNGAILDTEPIMIHATGEADTRYSGTRNLTTQSYNDQYRLKDINRGNDIITMDMNEGTDFSNAKHFYDDNNVWTSEEYDNSDKDNAALDVHWGAQKTYDYFKNKHNHDSYDGNGSETVKCYVHFDEEWANAAWSGGSKLIFGDGDDVIFDALTSLDVIAHEFGHAVCDFTCDLRYEKESGALNEGLSDIWGACVEEYAASGKDIWLIGEDIDLREGHNALRSLSNPNDEDLPDTYKGDYWYNVEGCSPDKTNDWCGVHTNNGVLSYWFYLLSEGGTGTNDNGDCYYLDGIGIDKASKIVYRLETVYLDQESDYSEARNFAIQAAKDLYGNNSVEVIETANAWYAVGIGDYYNIISGPTPLCSTSKTYSLIKIPSGCSVTWSATPSHLFTSTSGSGSTFSTAWDGSGSGTGTITASLSGECGSVDVDENVWVGKPVQPMLIFPNDQVAEGERYQACAVAPGASSYDWLVGGGSIIGGQGTDCIQFEVYCNHFLDLIVDGVNACGTGARGEKIVDIDCSGGGSWEILSIHPNPSDERLTVIVEENQDQYSSSSPKHSNHKTERSDTYTYYLYDLNYQLVRQFETNKRRVQINTNTLKGGFYILHVVKGEKVYRAKIEIRH